MELKDLKDKWIRLVSDMNKKGIPLPVLRDPKTGKGSVSLTLVFISFNVVLVGLIGKWGAVLDVDITQAMYLFLSCAGLYWGVKLTGDSKPDPEPKSPDNPDA